MKLFICSILAYAMSMTAFAQLEFDPDNQEEILDNTPLENPLIVDANISSDEQEVFIGTDIASVWDRENVQNTPLLLKPVTAIWEKTKDVGGFAKRHPFLAASPLLAFLAVRAIDKRLDDDVDKLGDALSGRSSGSSGPRTPIKDPDLFIDQSKDVKIKCIDHQAIGVRDSENVFIDNSEKTCLRGSGDD